MLTFSQDPVTADSQMRAVIFYLTAFGFIDGDFDESEKAFVRDYIRKLVEHRVDDSLGDEDPKLRDELVTKYTTHFLEVFEGIDRQVQDMMLEPVAAGEDRNAYVHTRLKLRCFEIFQSYDDQGKNELLDTVDELIKQDGQIHPAELKFRGEIAQLLYEKLEIELLEDEEAPRSRVSISPRLARLSKNANHPFFGQLEWTYQRENVRDQFEDDITLVTKVTTILDEQRELGRGKLDGHQSVQDFAGQESFLDGHVYVVPASTTETFELTVLGDLHGCYSCLKAALMQSQFFEKVNAYVNDPVNNPNPKLVLLGDYVDRGLLSYEGVLRGVMQVFTAAPSHVYMLRGNHEFYLEYKGDIYGGVKPSEAINSLKPYIPTDMFKRYLRLFDSLPNMAMIDRTLFVHAGIPRDSLIRERWKGLVTLNDPDIRFQMMWSDPSQADIIPPQLQQQSARFPFGRLQCQSFLQRIGCHTLVRGHEKFDEGFRRIYDDDDQLLLSLFSAGGRTNADLPADSSYRNVTPMALTITLKPDGFCDITPWEIAWEKYNDPSLNAFYRTNENLRL